MQTWLGYLFFTVIVGGGQIAAADAPFDVIIKGGTVYDVPAGKVMSRMSRSAVIASSA